MSGRRGLRPVEPRYKSLMVALVPQPRQMPPPPFDKGELQGIFAEVTRRHSYQAFEFTPNGRGALFSNGPDDAVELRPALLRIEAKMNGLDVLTAEMAEAKAKDILTLAAGRLHIEAFLQCAIQVIASVDAPGGDAKAFVAEHLMHGDELLAALGDGYFAGGARFRNPRAPGAAPDEDDLSIEPDVNDNRLVYLDYKVARTALTEAIGLDQMSIRVSDAFAFLDGPTMRLLSKQGD